MATAIQPVTLSLIDCSISSIFFPRQRKKGVPSGTPLFFSLAEWTGLEPATPGVTGRYSNQLNYHSSVVPPAPHAMREPAPRRRSISPGGC